MRSGACGAWVRHFRDVFHPGLAEVAAGRRRIIGPRPLAGATSSSSMPPASGSACGLINDALFLGPDGADPAIGYAADVLSAKPQSIGTVFRGVLRYADAVAKDWQASAAARGASRVAAGTNP
jgi:hypothetical protein